MSEADIQASAAPERRRADLLLQRRFDAVRFGIQQSDAAVAARLARIGLAERERSVVSEEPVRAVVGGEQEAVAPKRASTTEPARGRTMARRTSAPLRIWLDPNFSVSALLRVPQAAEACFVLAPGVAGMSEWFLHEVAEGLAQRRVATLRYQFADRERGMSCVDRSELAHVAVRTACAAAGAATGLPLVAGGKSFGARFTSQAQALQPLPGVAALAFLGFAMHSLDAPSSERAMHLRSVRVPMLFVQGTRDRLASHVTVAQLVAELGPRAKHLPIALADHDFERSRRPHGEVMADMLDAVAAWIRASVSGPSVASGAAQAASNARVR